MYSNKHAIRALAGLRRKLETKVFPMNTFSTLSFSCSLFYSFAFLHIHSYLKIYGVINVDFCVNCETVFFLSCSACVLFYRVHSVTEYHQVCKHFTPFPKILHSFALRAFQHCRQKTQQSFFHDSVQHSLKNIQQSIYRKHVRISCACVRFLFFGDLQRIINISRSGQSVYFDL